ncbi:hypothetical protein ABTY98_17825 [Streptomyces sp. NPDC096040]|uniref:hypothetical protein n=1 Tax=Streptomyces sp. NPDC096040 TaxID=3155541 RepID=UPI003330361D
MENVPVLRSELDETAPRPVAIARQLLVETDGLDYTELNQTDLSLIGRYEVVIAMLIIAVEDAAEHDHRDRRPHPRLAAGSSLFAGIALTATAE